MIHAIAKFWTDLVESSLADVEHLHRSKGAISTVTVSLGC